MRHEPNSDSPATGVRSVERALRLLRFLSPEMPQAGLSDFARHGKLAVSTTKRLLLTLENEGFLARLSNGNYTFGVSAIQVGLAARESVDLIDLARSHLESIAGLTGETVNLALLAGPGHALYVDQIQSPHQLRPHSWLGRTLPTESSAVGRALEGNTDEQGRVVARNTVEPDITAIASPVYNADGCVAAAISITAPTARVSAEQVERYAQWLTLETRALTVQVGGKWPHETGTIPTEDER